MFGNSFENRRVLITGHTGFKGSWLTSWLLRLGARVSGVSIDIPTQPSLFEVLGLEQRIEHHIADIRDLPRLKSIMEAFRPDFVFHLAAQPIVSLSYRDPVSTISTNALGTAHVMEVLRGFEHPCTAVIITSDKCYENVEWLWGYRETDHLGGKDIYSGSKAAAEAIFHAYQHSFFPPGHPVRLASARAGNVIGGGDWAADRIVADCVRAWSTGKPVELRSPSATRPWQHVLEPLSGYLALASALSQRPELHGESFNFGPRPEQNHTVLELLSALAEAWGFRSTEEACRITGHVPFHEAGLLRLNCDKAQFHLRWQASLDYTDCVALTGAWYRAHHTGSDDLYELTATQIDHYCEIARNRGMQWAAQA